MVGLFAVWASRVACLIAMWSVALQLAHADPAGMPSRRQRVPYRKSLRAISGVSIPSHSNHALDVGPDSDIYPAGDDGSDAYITFENGEIRGSLGCGQLTGRYGLSDDKVEISLGWTNERCGYRFRERADKVLSALRHAVRLGQRGRKRLSPFV